MHRNGSSLLIALMVMGILLSLSLGVSELLVGTLRENRALLERGQAWYAAESGLEQGLFVVATSGPGFEQKDRIEENLLNYEYAVGASAERFPDDGYAELRLNESVVIPLFRTREHGEIDAVKHFRVDFYLPVELQKQGGITYESLEVLRWKIFGIANQGISMGKMEVVNEFLPMETGKNSAEHPTCLGTSVQCWNGAKFFQFDPDTQEYQIVEKYPISTFLEQHDQNFLVLTNVVNTDLIAAPLYLEEKQRIANIQYRVIEEDGQPNLTLPRIAVRSDGFLGNAKQSVDVTVKREIFLPVFNYALYRTVEE